MLAAGADSRPVDALDTLRRPELPPARGQKKSAGSARSHVSWTREGEEVVMGSEQDDQRRKWALHEAHAWDAERRAAEAHGRPSRPICCRMEQRGAIFRMHAFLNFATALSPVQVVAVARMCRASLARVLDSMAGHAAVRPWLASLVGLDDVILRDWIEPRDHFAKDDVVVLAMEGVGGGGGALATRLRLVWRGLVVTRTTAMELHGRLMRQLREDYPIVEWRTVLQSHPLLDSDLWHSGMLCPYTNVHGSFPMRAAPTVRKRKASATPRDAPREPTGAVLRPLLVMTGAELVDDRARVEAEWRTNPLAFTMIPTAAQQERTDIRLQLPEHPSWPYDEQGQLAPPRGVPRDMEEFRPVDAVVANFWRVLDTCAQQSGNDRLLECVRATSPIAYYKRGQIKPTMVCLLSGVCSSCRAEGGLQLTIAMDPSCLLCTYACAPPCTFRLTPLRVGKNHVTNTIFDARLAARREVVVPPDASAESLEILAAFASGVPEDGADTLRRACGGRSECEVQRDNGVTLPMVVSGRCVRIDGSRFTPDLFVLDADADPPTIQLCEDLYCRALRGARLRILPAA